MGSAVGGRLRQNGARVLTSLQGRSAASCRRAEQHGIVAVGSDDELAQADFFLSILPPGDAPALAERMRAPLMRAPRKPVYIDFNAIAPDTAMRIGVVLAATGCRYLDGGIIGGPPKGNAPGPKFYISGAGAEESKRLAALGLRVEVLDGPIGAASALKMSYAGFTKGITGLAAAMIRGAQRAGAGEALRRELQESQPDLVAWLERYLPGMPPKAYRWAPEMEEIAAFLRDDAPAQVIYSHMARLYDALAADAAAGKAGGDVAQLTQFMNDLTADLARGGVEKAPRKHA
jgi:3-hydroxyisobutyrate dehydrogenase-like beta-hydroxyacid dehydrogenase